MCAAVEGAFKRIVADGRHFQSINLWRSADAHQVIEMMPLAVCDMRSVDPADIVFGDGMNTGRIEQYTKVVDQKIVHSEAQRWYYFPAMTPDEMLLFRQYDTREEAMNRRTVFHTAVADPTTRDDAPMRSTIEIRMQTVFDEEADKPGRVQRFMAEISDRYRDGRACDWWRGPIENTSRRSVRDAAPSRHADPGNPDPSRELIGRKRHEERGDDERGTRQQSNRDGELLVACPIEHFDDQEIRQVEKNAMT